jgi:hypothetical protein
VKAKLIVAVTLAGVVVSVYAFWDAIFSYARSLTLEDAIALAVGNPGDHRVTRPAQAGKVSGVPADTITQAAKVAQGLRDASDAYERGTTVERNHFTALALKARADSIDNFIAEIKKQPVTGKPADAEKKVPSLKALRKLAKLDE